MFNSVLGSIDSGRSPARPKQLSQGQDRPPSKANSHKPNTSMTPSQSGNRAAPKTPLDLTRPPPSLLSIHPQKVKGGTRRVSTNVAPKASRVPTFDVPKAPESAYIRPPVSGVSSQPQNLKRKASSDVPMPIQQSNSINSQQSKPPAKGSYAALMANVKERQKAAASAPPPSVGMIKNATTRPKEKISRIERRRRLEEEATSAQNQQAKRQKTLSQETGKRVTEKGAIKKPIGRPQSEYKGTAKPPEATRKKDVPTYRGTAGLAGKKPPSSLGKSRSRSGGEDRYLDTDEEEDDFVASDEDDGGRNGRRYTYASESDEDGAGSEESDDMEAGAFEVEREERVAAREAKLDDEMELKAEMRLKREKDERRRRLEEMSRKAGGKKRH
ncbi:MAG: hypothetical protein Q9160_008774 [Pyrenula sp. 1 TL-2023]